MMNDRQLAEVRKGREKLDGGARVVEAEKKLIICAIKKPLKLSESQDGQSRVRITFGHVHIFISWKNYRLREGFVTSVVSHSL